MRFRLLLPILLSFAVASSASAAEFYFGSTSQQVVAGQQIEVGVFLDTEGEAINAVSGEVTMPAQEFQPTDVRDANSIVPLWIQKPTIGGDAKALVDFSGIIPGGFTGRGELFSIILTVQGPVNAKTLSAIDLTATDARLNDGQGTATATHTAPLQLQFLTTGAAPPLPPVTDTDPPEPFVPEVAQDPSLFQNAWFVAFAAQDKGSGVDHYEVRERASDADNPSWTTVESPYQLNDQTRHSFIDVKAVDQAGNERVETVPPVVSPVPWYEAPWMWSIIVLVVIVLVLLWRNGKNKRKKPVRG